MTQNLMAANYGVPKVLYAGAMNGLVYTVPANTCVKIAQCSAQVLPGGFRVAVGGASSTIVTGGQVGPLSSADAMSATNMLAKYASPDHVITSAGTLSRVDLYAGQAGSVIISIGSVVSNKWVARKWIAAQPVAVGLNTLVCNEAVSANEIVALFSPDGAKFTYGASTGSTLWQMPTTGGGPASIANNAYAFRITVETGIAPIAYGRITTPDSVSVPELAGHFFSSGDRIYADGQGTMVISGVEFS